MLFSVSVLLQEWSTPRVLGLDLNVSAPSVPSRRRIEVSSEGVMMCQEPQRAFVKKHNGWRVPSDEAAAVQSLGSSARGRVSKEHQAEPYRTSFVQKHLAEINREQPLFFFSNSISKRSLFFKPHTEDPISIKPWGSSEPRKPLGTRQTSPTPNSLASPRPPLPSPAQTSRRLSAEVCFHPTLPSHGTAETCHS